MSTFTPLPVMSQIALPNLRASVNHSLYSGGVHLGQLAPAVEILAVDDALGAEAHDEVALVLVGDDADGVGARGVGMSWIAKTPRPPEAPQTSTFWPGFRSCG
jgi:hypothetical protein